MKDPKDYRKWTHREIEESPKDYVKAQERTHRREAWERARQAEAADRERFIEQFLRDGGTRSGARAEWEKRRNESAAESAAAHDAAAWRFTQSEAWRVV